MHVVGASADSELWGWDGKNEQHAALGAYAEASSGLASYLEESLPPDAASSSDAGGWGVSIRCAFVRLDCPPSRRPWAEAPIPDSKSAARLIVETRRGNYGEGGGDPTTTAARCLRPMPWCYSTRDSRARTTTGPRPSATPRREALPRRPLFGEEDRRCWFPLPTLNGDTRANVS
jgi:hypothetical protein